MKSPFTKCRYVHVYQYVRVRVVSVYKEKLFIKNINNTKTLIHLLIYLFLQKKQFSFRKRKTRRG